MNKSKWIVVLLVVTAAALAVAGIAYAQTPTPPNPQTPYGPGMMGRGGMRGGGMMGGWRGNGEYGPMHEYMEKAIAEALGMSEEELEAALEDGKTMWQVAEEKGLTAEKFQEVMLTARQEAIEQMVADGVLTKEQGDWMLSRMQNRGGRGGFGGCPGMGGGYSPRSPGSRWNTPPSAPQSTNTSIG